jgi:hypothetical protein
MKNKIVIGVATLLVGFLLGGVAFYLLGQYTEKQKVYVPAVVPNVPRQVIETSRAFTEIAGRSCGGR